MTRPIVLGPRSDETDDPKNDDQQHPCHYECEELEELRWEEDNRDPPRKGKPPNQDASRAKLAAQ